MRQRSPSSTATPQLRVAFLSTASNIGGMERVVCGLAREFTTRGWSVQPVFPQSAKSEALLRWCRDQGVTAMAHPSVLDADAKHRWRDVRALIRFLQKHRPDVVNIHYGDNFISLKDVIAVRLAGLHRCVVSVHHPTSWANTAPRKRRMTAIAALLAHDVTTFSHATYNILREAPIAPSKLHLIPCGVRPPQQALSQAEARARLGLPADRFIVGSLARLVRHKGIDDLIEAVAQLDLPAGRVLLVVGGDGPERERLEQHARQRLGANVQFLGRLPEVESLLAACDIFALPSHLEGFGLVYVEAAFQGVPSIGTNVGGIPDAVIHGETGLLVPVGDHAALAQAIHQLHQSPELRRRLGDAARARARTELTEQAMAQRFEQVFLRGSRQPSLASAS